MFGHRAARNRTRHAGQDRSPTDGAALQLLALDDYRCAERLCDGHLESIACDLNASREILVAYQSMLRTDARVYLDPHTGTPRGAPWVGRMTQPIDHWGITCQRTARPSTQPTRSPMWIP